MKLLLCSLSSGLCAGPRSSSSVSMRSATTWWGASAASSAGGSVSAPWKRRNPKWLVFTPSVSLTAVSSAAAQRRAFSGFQIKISADWTQLLHLELKLGYTLQELGWFSLQLMVKRGPGSLSCLYRTWLDGGRTDEGFSPRCTDLLLSLLMLISEV